LRLVGTRNSKSGTIVKAIWEDAKDIWTFDDLANEILPFTREELEKLRAKRREESGDRTPSKGHRRTPKSRDDVEKRFNRHLPRPGTFERPTAPVQAARAG
jgi:hypothetical protein